MVMATPPGWERGDREYLASAAAAVQSGTTELEYAIKALPPVDQDGNSPCPDAEARYAHKEKCLDALSGEVQWLLRLLPLLERQIQRYGYLEEVVTAGAGKLHNDQARGFFNEAGKLVDLEHRSYVEIRAAIMLVLQRAQAAMVKAMSKQYPGRAPQEATPSATPGLPIPVPPHLSPAAPAELPPAPADPLAPPGQAPLPRPVVLPRSSTPASRPVPLPPPASGTPGLPSDVHRELSDLYHIDIDRPSGS
jgi:hypothetical protein